VTNTYKFRCWINSSWVNFEGREKALRIYPLDAMPIPVEISIQQHTDAIISGQIPKPKECCHRGFSKPVRGRNMII